MGLNFKIIKTRVQNSPKFNLTIPSERMDYFRFKAGGDIDKIVDFLKAHTFVAFMLAPKMAGKGTFTKMLQEVLGVGSTVHLAVGDLIRQAHLDYDAGSEAKQNLLDYFDQHYRGFMPLTDAFQGLVSRDNKSLAVPAEFILTLLKREIDRVGRKAVFIDGFPRALDQVQYSLYFRQLINYRDDPDFFVLIDLPRSIIDARIKHRRVCPKCQTSKNSLLNPTSKAAYDKENDEFYLLCDNVECESTRLVKKEGDEHGIAHIADRLDTDWQLMQQAEKLQGIQHIHLRNDVPAAQALEWFNDYELTPQFDYELDGDKVKITTQPLILKDDNGVPVHSLMAATVVLSMIKQLVKTLELD